MIAELTLAAMSTATATYSAELDAGELLGVEICWERRSNSLF